MASPKIPKFVTPVTIMSLGGSIPGALTTPCIIEGSKKLDGPNYVSGVLLKVYQALYPDSNIVECRCDVSGIYSSNQFHHYNCSVFVRTEDNQTKRDSLILFIDRPNMQPYTEE